MVFEHLKNCFFFPHIKIRGLREKQFLMFYHNKHYKSFLFFLFMIVIDIETSGLDFMKNGIISIGAIDFNNPDNFFYEECRIDDEDEITEGAMKINGFGEEEFRSRDKQSQEELIKNFYGWLEKQEVKMLAGHNVGFFDLNFIKQKAEKYGVKIKSRYRNLDLCSVSQTLYFQVNKRFLLDELNENAMNLSKVLEFCGLSDDRISFEENKVKRDGKPHNSLEDAKLAAECFSRLINGKDLFKEFSKFPVPNYLRR